MACALTGGGGGGVISSFQKAEAVIDGKQGKQPRARLAPRCTASWEIISLI